VCHLQVGRFWSFSSSNWCWIERNQLCGHQKLVKENKLKMLQRLNGGGTIFVTVIIDYCNCGCHILRHQSSLSAVSVNIDFKSSCCAWSVRVSGHDDDWYFLDEELSLKIGEKELICLACNGILNNSDFTVFRNIV